MSTPDSEPSIKKRKLPGGKPKATATGEEKNEYVRKGDLAAAAPRTNRNRQVVCSDDESVGKVGTDKADGPVVFHDQATSSKTVGKVGTVKATSSTTVGKVGASDVTSVQTGSTLLSQISTSFRFKNNNIAAMIQNFE